MPDPRPHHLRHLFDLALALPPAAWPGFAAKKCGTDEDLKRRLLAMLAAAGDATPVPPPEPAAVPAAPTEGPGTRLGPYRLLQQIGEGGFGLVFLAHQEEPVDRKVALKIIKLGMDTRQVVARFEQERQALALMEHPNIARVLDAGATATGRPYFVMDLVKGLPILEYCDRNRLAVAERLRLFAQVCSAVQHAHGKGIIHRDLKPSNVLVGTQDGQPHAKVIDFGIAKATSQRLTEKTLFTEHHQIVGTLQYMSPEQAEGSLDIDTRTDVYSLGVMLYELLAGSPPFDVSALRNAMFGEVQRLICEVDPPRPSTRITESQETLAALAAQRRIHPKKLGLLLRGDLDWIVMRALEKDRARRYETAHGLALDVQRYLAGEPVVAAPPSALYRMRKFVRRHRAGVGAAVTTLGVLVLGIVAFAWQARVAERERVRAVSAEHETAKAVDELRVVVEFQSDMLGNLDVDSLGLALAQDVLRKHDAAARSAAQRESFRSEWARISAADVARDMLARTILAPAVAAVTERFHDEPAIASKLRQTLSDLHQTLGLVEAGLPIQRAAYEDRERLYGAEHEHTLESRKGLAGLLQMQGNLDEAERHFREVLAVRHRNLGAEHPSTLIAETDLGLLLMAKGSLQDAEKALRDAVEKLIRVRGANHDTTLRAKNNLAMVLERVARHDESESLLRDVLAARRASRGEKHIDTVLAIANLGLLLSERGKLTEAEPLLLEAYERRRELQGEEHSDTMIAHNNLAMLVLERGRYGDAARMHREILARRRRVLGDEHRETLVSRNNLGFALERAQEYAEAEVVLRETLTIRERVLGEDHLETLNAMQNLGNVLTSLDRSAEAKQHFERILEITKRVHSDEHPVALGALNSLGALLQARDEFAEAATCFRKVVAKLRKVLGAEHPNTLVAMHNLATAELGLGRLDEAEAASRAATEGLRKVIGSEHPTTLGVWRGLGVALAAQGKHADALEVFTAMEPASRAVFRGPSANSLAFLLMRLAVARAHLAKSDESMQVAAQNLAEALTILDATSATTTRDRRKCAEAHAEVYGLWEALSPGQGHAARAALWKAK